MQKKNSKKFLKLMQFFPMMKKEKNMILMDMEVKRMYLEDPKQTLKRSLEIWVLVALQKLFLNKCLVVEEEEQEDSKDLLIPLVDLVSI
jgi:hypothetical protein